MLNDILMKYEESIPILLDLLINICLYVFIFVLINVSARISLQKYQSIFDSENEKEFHHFQFFSMNFPNINFLNQFIHFPSDMYFLKKKKENIKKQNEKNADFLENQRIYFSMNCNELD